MFFTWLKSSRVTSDGCIFCCSGVSLWSAAPTWNRPRPDCSGSDQAGWGKPLSQRRVSVAGEYHSTLVYSHGWRIKLLIRVCWLGSGAVTWTESLWWGSDQAWLGHNCRPLCCWQTTPRPVSGSRYLKPWVRISTLPLKVLGRCSVSLFCKVVKMFFYYQGNITWTLTKARNRKPQSQRYLPTMATSQRWATKISPYSVWMHRLPWTVMSSPCAFQPKTWPSGNCLWLAITPYPGGARGPMEATRNTAWLTPLPCHHSSANFLSPSSPTPSAPTEASSTSLTTCCALGTWRGTSRVAVEMMGVHWSRYMVPRTSW